MNRDGATKMSDERNEIDRLFAAAQGAILMLIGKFCNNAIQAGNRAVLVEFGGNVMRLLNDAINTLNGPPDDMTIN